MTADRHRHEALLYSSHEELLAVLVPFLSEGFDAGDPTLVALSGGHTDLLRATVPAGQPFEVLPADGYARPARVIRAYQERMAAYVRAGATRIRLVGALPAASFGATWDWWARYEATVNRAFSEFPAWCMCVYDRRVTPPEVLQDVERTHPVLIRPNGVREPSPAYLDPATYLGETRSIAADPVQHSRHSVTLSDPAPVEARAAVRNLDRGHVSDGDVEDLVLAVSETVSNAIRHGRSPVEVRMWTGGDRIVVTVSDAGPGPADPFAGLLPSADGNVSGRGLWITYQSVNHVSTMRRPGRFTIRLTAGNPH